MARFGDSFVVAKRTIAEAREDRISMTAQALAYSLFLAIPSVLLVVLGVFSMVASPSDVTRLIDRLKGIIPPDAATLLENGLQRSVQGGNGLVLTVVGLVLALWTVTSAATTLMQGITTAFDRDDNRGFARKRLLALVILLCLLAAAALVGAFLVFGPYLERWVGDTVGQPTVTAWIWWTAQWPILVFALLGAFAVLLYLGPDVEQPSWKWVTPGAVVALVIWLAASAGFSFYASHFGSYNKTWGSVAAVVIMLVWLWLTSLALLVGAEINSETQKLASERGELSEPVPMRSERRATAA
jgi:membrane protein